MFLFSGSCIISNLAFLGTLGQQEKEDYEQQLGSTAPSSRLRLTPGLVLVLPLLLLASSSDYFSTSQLSFEILLLAPTHLIWDMNRALGRQGLLL